MIKAYDMLGMSVLDHIILGPDSRFYSMKEHDVFGLPCTEYCTVLEDLEFSPLKQQNRNRDEAR